MSVEDEAVQLAAEMLPSLIRLAQNALSDDYDAEVERQELLAIQERAVTARAQRELKP